MDSQQLELDELIEVEDATGASPTAVPTAIVDDAIPTTIPALGPPPPAPSRALAKGTSEVDLAASPSSLADLEIRFDRCLAGLQMHFQPIVYPDRGRFGYEALLR